ncbi:hypothetical protein BGZ57DRAFT_847425 [Hyaloscypha finlandica]|nr:hypothetical protein BGZ57DRAFT_847425 [Hyaloscypha finlandica]
MTDPKPNSTITYCKKPRKRPYRKSTKGCKDCKARKIKCDERRPVCGNLGGRNSSNSLFIRTRSQRFVGNFGAASPVHKTPDHTLALASGQYLGKTLKEHRAAVETKDLRNPEELIIAAVLIAHHHWLSASTNMHPSSGYKAAPWLSTNNEDACASIDNQIEYLPFPRFLKSASDDIDSLLQTLEEDSASQEVKDVYERVAGFLKATYSRIAHGSFGNPPIEQDITAFLPHAPQLFIKHLEKNEPLSMAMLARNIALLGILPDSGAWWIHGAGQHKMADTTVNGIWGLMPPEYL